MDDVKLEVYRTLYASQDKYTYFMLGATVASIGFAITQTQNLRLELTQIPLGLALLCWGLSFWFGSLNRRYYNSYLFANYDLLRIQRGEHPETGQHPQMIQAASEGIKIAMDKSSNKAGMFANLQTYFFILGAGFYIGWHILEMYLKMQP